jgi:pyrroloquinoline quinone biosynthesis protein E
VVTVPAPFALLAELTHRCPLRCTYCSNPTDLTAGGDEIATSTWQRVFSEAAALGVAQVHLSGGEPLARADLVELVATARAEELYSNLITSGIGLSPRRAEALAAAGLNSAQLSVQGADEATTLAVAGREVLADKRRSAAAIVAAGLPLSMNVVLHRGNLDQLEAIVGLCIEWGATRLELANTQYYGWALRNSAHLLPDRSQLQRAEAVYDRIKTELQGVIELLWIIPDWFETRPKPCMGGWARTALTVTPDGTALPCPTARGITSLDFPLVTEHSLDWIWVTSSAFNAFRGPDWFPEPCRSCEYRDRDFGGCRCQAFALTGDAAVTDPVCTLSPQRGLVDALLAGAGTTGAPVAYRISPRR